MGVIKLGFNVQPTTRSYGDGTSVSEVSSERPEKRGANLVIHGLVVQCVIHYTTAAPKKKKKEKKSSGNFAFLPPIILVKFQFLV